MASTMKDKVAEAGHAVADAAKTVGHKIAEGAEFVKEKTGIGSSTTCHGTGSSGIQEHMDVIASCGKKVGVVDRIEGNSIKLTKKDSPDNQHHFIPVGWVDHVDNHVHLSKNSQETEQGWKSDMSSCGC